MNTNCPICHSEITDKVHMTCKAMHSFCFKCILKCVEKTSKLTVCPLCRGGEKFIILDSNVRECDEFGSTCHLMKSVSILQKVLSMNLSTNSCIVSESLLINYIKNKKQLELAHKLLNENYKIEDIILLIKWDSKKSFENMGSDFVSDFVGGFVNEIFSQTGSNILSMPTNQI